MVILIGINEISTNDTIEHITTNQLFIWKHSTYSSLQRDDALSHYQFTENGKKEQSFDFLNQTIKVIVWTCHIESKAAD